MTVVVAAAMLLGVAANGADEYQTEGFKNLSAALGAAIVGEPTGPEQGTIYGTMQITTTGVVYWQKATETVAWTDGYNRKGFRPGTMSVVEWVGDSMEAPPLPIAAPEPAVGVWDRLAGCESNGLWSLNTGNGFYGGLQFTRGTWLANGGGQYAPYAHQATRAQQIGIAETVRAAARGSYRDWPACRRTLGLP